MRAGELDRRITVQSATTTTNAVGQDVKTWTDYKTIWAKVKEENPSERIRANRVDARMTYVITTRYRTDLTTDMRIVYGGNALDIHGIQEIGRKEGLLITAS